MGDKEIIERDLDQRIFKKLRQWMKDSAALYEMAELEDGYSNAVLIMTRVLAMALVRAGMPRETFLQAMGKAYDLTLEDYEEGKKLKEKRDAANR